jgi:hypothetical protein
MIELLLINATYVAYRLIVTAHVVKFFNRYVNYYVAVFLAAQISFAYDNGLFAWFFSTQNMPRLAELFYADIMYTLRVIAAWWLIKQIWAKVKNYYLAVFIGAEITFVIDYFIFDRIY